MKLKIALGQINCKSGDLRGNTNQIIESIRRAKVDSVDILVLPETSITGYCCGSKFDEVGFIQYQLDFLNKKIIPEVDEKLTVILGYVRLEGITKMGFPKIYNTAAVIQNKQLIFTYDKQYLANGHHHEDRKYFAPGLSSTVASIKIKEKYVKIGIPICEDGWNTDHKRDIVKEMVDMGAEIIISINQSYFYYGKSGKRENIFGFDHAFVKRLPVVYVNNVGMGDIVKNFLIYDGCSFASDKGDIVARCANCWPDYQVCEVDTAKEFPKKKITSWPIRHNYTLYDKYTQIHKALIFAIRKTFSELGFQKAQVHLSGGIDSAIVAVLAKQALGAENCIFITNPSTKNSSITQTLAQNLATSLGVKLFWESIEESFQNVCSAHKTAFGSEPSPIAQSSIQATLRTVMGIAGSHTFKAGIIATGNHTEIVEGWASFHDIGSIGVFSLIGDLTKVEVFEFAKWLNKNTGAYIPEELYDGRVKPAAELVDANEDPFDYFVRSGIDAEMIRERKEPEAIIEDFKNKTLTKEYFPKGWDGKDVYERISLEDFEKQVMSAFTNSRRSVYKAAQSAPIVIISPRSRGFSNRETILNFYEGRYEF